MYTKPRLVAMAVQTSPTRLSGTASFEKTILYYGFTPPPEQQLNKDTMPL